MTAAKVFAPKIGKSVFIHGTATVQGNVTLGDHASIWPGCVLRADLNQIVVGAYTNIQDLSVLHLETDRDCRVGDDCVVGHRVILHGCRVGNGVLVGMGAIILNGARIGNGALIGAGALVLEGTQVEPETLYLGMPAKRIRKLTRREIKFTRDQAKKYARVAREHMEGHFISA
jgi:gamma-carbonic anhydrase